MFFYSFHTRDTPSCLVIEEVCTFATESLCLYVLWEVVSAPRVGWADSDQCVKVGDGGRRCVAARAWALVLSIAPITATV